MGGTLEGTVDAWCVNCGEVRRHDVQDPGSCKCTVCGHVEPMFAPLKEGSAAPR